MILPKTQQENVLGNLPYWAQMAGLGDPHLLPLLPKGVSAKGVSAEQREASEKAAASEKGVEVAWVVILSSSGGRLTLGCQGRIAPSRGSSQTTVLHGLPSLVGNSFHPRP